MIQIKREGDTYSVVLTPELSVGGFESEASAGRWLIEWLLQAMTAAQDAARKTALAAAALLEVDKKQ